MKLFDEASPWITEDNRRLRPVSRTTPDSMNHKHAAMLPPDTLGGRTVLDLGCCLGGTGYWALRHGAARYTGVEVQEEYARLARTLLAAHGLASASTIHQADLTRWLEQRNPTGSLQPVAESHDVVVLAGVLYGFTDPLYVLRMACGLARECVVIDMRYPANQQRPDAAYIEVIPEQQMALATHDDAIATGAGSRISPAGLDAIMANYGFTAGRMPVAPILDTHDSYNAAFMNAGGGVFPLRYITRFTRSSDRSRSVNETIVSGEVRLAAHRSAPHASAVPAQEPAVEGQR